MATSSSIPMKDQYTNFPPKRGKIKAQIFWSAAETIVSMALKAGEPLIKIKENGASAPASPPPSSYNSDG